MREEERGALREKNRAEKRVTGDPQAHMANERTFLSWIRTSIAIMAFGFVVEKFSLFLKQMSYYMGAEPSSEPHRSFSSSLGVVLIVLGAVMAVLAFVRYKKVEREIDEGTYRPSLLLDLLLIISLLSVSLFLLIFLLHSL